MDEAVVRRFAAGALGAGAVGIAVLAPERLPSPLGFGLGPWHVAACGVVTMLACLPLRPAMGLAMGLALVRYGIASSVVLLPTLLVASSLGDEPGTRRGVVLLWILCGAAAVAVVTDVNRTVAARLEPPDEAPPSTTGRTLRTSGFLLLAMIAAMATAFVYAEAILASLTPEPTDWRADALAAASELAALFGGVAGLALLLVVLGALLERWSIRHAHPGLTGESAAVDRAARNALTTYLDEAAPLAGREATRWRDLVRDGVLLIAVALGGGLLWLGTTRLMPWHEAVLADRAGDAAWAVLVPLGLPASALVAPWLLLPLTALVVLPFTLTPRRAARAQLCTGPTCGACTTCRARLLDAVTRAVRRGRVRPGHPFSPGRWLVRRQLARLGWAMLAMLATAALVAHVLRDEARSYVLFTPDDIEWSGLPGSSPDGRVGYEAVRSVTIRCEERGGFRLRYAVGLRGGATVPLIAGPSSLRRQDAAARAAWRQVDAILRDRAVPRRIEAADTTCAAQLKERVPLPEARSLTATLVRP